MFWIKVLSLSGLLLLVDCLPTSVLLDAKTLKSGDDEKLPVADGGHGHSGGASSSSSALTGGDVSGQVKSNPKKRGVNAALLQDPFLSRGDLYLLNQQQQRQRPDDGVWSDLMDDGYFERSPPSLSLIGGRSEDDERRRGGGFYDTGGYYGYNTSPYGDEDLEDLINSRDGFAEPPIAMPVISPGMRGEPGGFYGISPSRSGGSGLGYRRKRAEKKSKTFRLKRENDQVDAAEALALLELIEAQEAARRHNRERPKEDYFKYLFPSENNPDEDIWINARIEPSAHYYGLPQTSAAYKEYDNYYGPSASKRFMVAKRKKKRSLMSADDESMNWRMGMKSSAPQRLVNNKHLAMFRKGHQ